MSVDAETIQCRQAAFGIGSAVEKGFDSTSSGAFDLVSSRDDGEFERFDAVAVSVAYRLAPEFIDPVPVEDCYAGLVWMADRADELGVGLSRMMIVGQSAGAGLAAGTALLARDRGGPRLSAQLRLCPMIDDRNTTKSSEQFDGFGPWDRAATSPDGTVCSANVEARPMSRSTPHPHARRI
ncbi:alpha/beta hydrolase fold domain-containing protein [Nocardia salmonicida]|uniref:alpha/beta hydrolase fold domain-containing protein n=1 Tax=Nocardia salmonicida TaxID=53431 RepID=UPI0033F40F35